MAGGSVANIARAARPRTAWAGRASTAWGSAAAGGPARVEPVPIRSNWDALRIPWFCALEPFERGDAGWKLADGRQAEDTLQGSLDALDPVVEAAVGGLDGLVRLDRFDHALVAQHLRVAPHIAP